MKDIKLSATRISTFLKCKRKYWFQYVEHLPKLSNPSFKLGLACHESLELAGKIWIKKEKFSKTDKQKILGYYDKISIREGIEEMAVHAEGKRLVKNRINDFALGTKIISLEERFGFGNGNYPDLKTNLGIPLIGAMDKVIELDEDSLLVVDYKTSRTAPTADQLKEDLQLSLYDLVANLIWPKYKRIILCLDMLRSEPIYTYRTVEQREDFNKYLTVVYKEMASLKEKGAYASLNTFCPWCDFKDYCKIYEEACTKSEYDFLPSFKLTDEELINEHELVKSTSKILDTRKRELAMLIMEKIKREGTDLKGEDIQMCIRQNARTNYDAVEVAKVIPQDDFATMVTLRNKDVDAYCARHPNVKKQVEKSSITNYTSPFLATKKLKKEKVDGKKTNK